MTWVLIGTALLIAATVVLFLLGRRLWRQGKGLAAEIAAAADRLDTLTGSLDGQGGPPAHHRPGTAVPVAYDPWDGVDNP